MAESAFLSLKPGSIVSSEGNQYSITHVLGLDSVLARNLETQALDRLYIGNIQQELAPEEESETSRDLEDFKEKEWAIAQRRFAVIKPLLDDPFRTREKVLRVAKNAGVNTDTLYVWIRSYLDSGRLSSLVPQKVGRKLRSYSLPPATQKIIELTIQDFYLTKERKTRIEVIEEVTKRCKQAGIDPPHSNTIRNRIRQVAPKTKLIKRGHKDVARNLYEPIRGPYNEAKFPLSIVQIDHTPANVIIVEESTRLALGRPYLTLAIDVFSRMITGYHVSLEKPSAMTVGMCIVKGMLPKLKLLADLEVPGSWPVWGKPQTFHVDNAREFRGSMLEKSCQQYGIDLQFRPVKKPHFGGHIERLMGTAATEIQGLPGKTFSSPAERKGYDSDKESAMTLREFEQHLVDFIVNIYHERKHQTLKKSPKRCWELGLMGDSAAPATGLPDIPANPERLRLDFLPFVMRTVQPYGLVIDDIFYYHEVLNPLINSVDPDEPKRKLQFVVRRDFEDLSHVYLFDPQLQQYHVIPYRNSTRPPINLWELRAIRKQLKEEDQEHTNEDAIFEARQRMLKRIDTSKAKTKAARRQLHRLRNTEVKAGVSKVIASSSQLKTQDSQNVARSIAQAEQSDEFNLFSQPVKHSEDVELDL